MEDADRMSTRSEESRSAIPAEEGHGSNIWTALSRRGVVVGVVVGVPVSVWLLGLSSRHLDAAAFRAAIRNAHPAPVLLAVCAMALVYIAQALRWRLVAGTRSTPWGTFLRWVVGAVAVNN